MKNILQTILASLANGYTSITNGCSSAIASVAKYTPNFICLTVIKVRQTFIDIFMVIAIRPCFLFGALSVFCLAISLIFAALGLLLAVELLALIAVILAAISAASILIDAFYSAIYESINA